MKVLLLKDVYNLGRAGDVKKVANGYGRNFLIPQRLAMLATPGALKQSDRIRNEADKRRTVLNEELASVADELAQVHLQFPAKAGETGKLYGSVTTKIIATELSEKINVEITKRQIDSQPLRLLGLHKLKVRLTIDLIPELSIVVYREGEPPENYMIDAQVLASQTEELVAAELEEQAEEEATDEQQEEEQPPDSEKQAEEPAADEKQDEEQPPDSKKQAEEPAPDEKQDEEQPPEPEE